MGFGIKKIVSKKSILFVLIACVASGGLIYKMCDNWFFAPWGVRRLAHLIFQPKDLYDPLVVDCFLFYEQGFTKTYTIVPKYFDIYEVGFFIEGSKIESTYRFNGKIELEFYEKEDFVYGCVVDAIASAVYDSGDMKYFRKVSLKEFPIPIQNKYAKNIRVKVTVLDPDETLKKYKNKIKLYIAVSSVP